MLRTRLLVLVLVVSASCDGATSMGDRVGAYAFVGANVIPMSDPELLLADHTVVVEGDGIVAVGPRRELPAPSGAVVIDARGKYLLPGLADMHVHLEHFDDPAVLRLFVANGVTLVRNMDGRPYLLDWKVAVESGELLGPRIVTAGPILDGDPPARDDNVAIASAEEARAEVAAQAARGYDFVKVYTNLPQDAYSAVLEAAASLGLSVAGHAPRGVPFRLLLEGRQASLEHLDGFDEVIEADDSPYRGRWHWTKLYLAMPADSTKIERAAELAERAELWNVPTLALRRKVAAEEVMMGWLAEPEIVHVPPTIRQYWESQAHEIGRQVGPEELELLSRGERTRGRLVTALHRAGAGVLVGSDTPNPFLVPGFSVHDELASFVDAGLTPGQALLSATREAARFLGELSDAGTVEPGKRADLLLLDANPLASIQSTRAISGVMLRGVWISDPESLLTVSREP